ncbi:hypothetical protein [Phaeobacter italicus]|uniref:hypothetical protein n=1 Tax=Phaeobacter italicus TaxID=481446 RepID=UPI00248D6A4C|nr:hypothetical protein [Phaeobacter italicus]
MIDHQDKTMWLINAMAEAPALTARMSPELKAMVRKKEPATVLPDTCTIQDIIYTGEEGGITCKLGFGQENETTVILASITHLIFDRRCPLHRQITAYQKHRVKKIKKQSKSEGHYAKL